jgi:hypothetical protein
VGLPSSRRWHVCRKPIADSKQLCDSLMKSLLSISSNNYGHKIYETSWVVAAMSRLRGMAIIDGEKRKGCKRVQRTGYIKTHDSAYNSSALRETLGSHNSKKPINIIKRKKQSSQVSTGWCRLNVLRTGEYRKWAYTVFYVIRSN